MIQLLDGTKLLTHEELYKKFDKIAVRVYTEIATAGLKSLAIKSIITKLNLHPNLTKEISERCNLEPLFTTILWEVAYTFETGKKWDIVIGREEMGERAVTGEPVYCIEYKSHIKEWGKEFHKHLAQITKRSSLISPDRYLNVYGEKVLMSFDKRFLEYENVLKNNHIKLVILPQEIIEQMKEKVIKG